MTLRADGDLAELMFRGRGGGGVGGAFPPPLPPFPTFWMVKNMLESQKESFLLEHFLVVSIKGLRLKVFLG